jgi:hypothetical protein
MSTPLAPELLSILLRALGLDAGGCRSGGRNHFTADPATPDGIKCQELCQLGLMKDHSTLTGYGHYCVTEQGKVIAWQQQRPKAERRQRVRGEHEVVRVGKRLIPILGVVNGTPEQSRETVKNIEEFLDQAAGRTKVEAWPPQTCCASNADGTACGEPAMYFDLKLGAMVCAAHRQPVESVAQHNKFPGGRLTTEPDEAA